MTDPADDKSRRAAALLEQAAALRERDDEAALALYAQVLMLAPDCMPAHYDIGLIHKYRGEWADSLTANAHAAELAPDDEAANWNLAIAATALRDWRAARSAWHRLGLPIEPGDEPIEADFGIAPVRLNQEANGEVVWGRRVCPVRVRIESVPLPQSGFRCGDVVLHDGAPNGSRTAFGREYAVFDVLDRFEDAGLPTWIAEITAASEDDVAALEKALDEAGIMHEHWTRNVRILCKACSEGRPHEQHEPV